LFGPVGVAAVVSGLMALVVSYLFGKDAH
jgi:hypothetical protein